MWLFYFLYLLLEALSTICIIQKSNMDLDFVNISEFTNAQIAEHMRRCNYEKYITLVRMHLSFELDLNTDEFDLPYEIAYEDKGKLKKWNRISKKHKMASGACSSSVASPTEIGANMQGVQQQIDAGFYAHLKELKDFLMLEKNVTQEGIFRKTGSASRQNELRMKIQNDKILELEQAGYSAHDCATIFKGYLSDLPEPLLTDALYPAHLQIAPLCCGGYTAGGTKPLNQERLKREQHLLNSIQLLLLLLPNDNREMLQHIVEMLNVVAKFEAHNKMSPENLATLFAPHLICPRNMPPEALHFVSKNMSGILAYMFAKGLEIFEVPSKLATDIRAYFLERKRKKTMSPEQTLDESISDISTVNTVYTFVDREKTAAAHHTNNTDTELAQLYAHIQSMPESSKKRRLIKQFNKQNGQGTPLQLVVMNRLKNSEASRSAKSIGDSIKKHIFHKSIMSRTPKRGSGTMSVGMETPNFSHAKNPKLRVLFQSPAPSTKGSQGSLSTHLSNASCSPSASSSSSACSSNACPSTPYALKSHPLQKSVSSTSLYVSSKGGLLAANAMTNCEEFNTNSSSNDVFNNRHLLTSKEAASCSVSAPVSRQVSSDLNQSSSSAHSQTYYAAKEANCCATPLKIITEAAKHIMGTADNTKKTVAWDENHLLEVEEYSQPNTPTKEQNNTRDAAVNSSDLKSRYKSEPNLSCMLHKDKMSAAHNHDTTPLSKCGKSLTRKLMKGVSMGNLKFPFSTPESTKRLVRTVSSTLKRRLSDETQTCLISSNAAGSSNSATSSTIHLGVANPLNCMENLEDLDDDHDFEECSEDNLNSSCSSDLTNEDENAVESNYAEDMVDHGSSSNELRDYLPCAGGVAAAYQQLMLQQSSLYRNIDLITSTPSLLLGRRSMSPITKSTQRMPKAMQESIMTPRSRKPVMVLTNTLGSSDPNQTLYQTDLSSFREDEEDSLVAAIGSAVESLPPPNLHSEDAISVGTYADLLQHRQQLVSVNPSFTPQETSKLQVVEVHSDSREVANEENPNALTNNFKAYLRSRSVLTASPADSSFSSQPDDFQGEEDDSSTREIQELDDSKLSHSLLYCLDGNQPQEETVKNCSLSNEDEELEQQETSSCINKISVPLQPLAATPLGSTRFNSLSSNPFVILNNARKRAATSDLPSEKTATNLFSNSNCSSSSSSSSGSNSPCSSNDSSLSSKNSNKENCGEHYVRSKKLLISEFPGETSF